MLWEWKNKILNYNKHKIIYNNFVFNFVKSKRISLCKIFILKNHFYQLNF